MTDDGRLTIRFPEQIADYVERTARAHGLTRQGVIRRALGMAQAFDMETAGGRYVGSASDREALEVVIVAPL